MRREFRRILVFIWLIGLGFLAQAQVNQEQASVDIVTKKLEKMNSALQSKIAKVQKKLEKKLLKKFPYLDQAQLDSMMASQNSLDLPDSVKRGVAKYCTGCPDINEIKTELKEKINLTPPNLDIAKDLNISIKELDKLEGMMQKLQIPNLEQFKSLDVKSMAGEKLPLPEVEGLKSTDLKALGLEKSPISPSDLKNLKEKSGDLSGLLDEYKKEFEGWEEKALTELTSLEEFKLLQEQKKKMEAYSPLPEGYRENIEQFQTNDFVKTKLEAKAEEFKKIGQETLQSKFDEAMTEVTKAKKKFPSLESLKDAPKRPPNPLKDEPFTKRLRFGGNFQVNRQNPGSIDLSLKVGYLLNPKAQVGIGTAYRISTGENFSSFDFNGDVFTTKMFFDHFVYKSLYVQAVMEWNRTQLKDQDEVSLGTQWVQSGLAGIGKEFTITKKLKGSMSILYNFLHDENSPYQRPWVFRVGFRL